jgi:hypothetical protein
MSIELPLHYCAASASPTAGYLVLSQHRCLGSLSKLPSVLGCRRLAEVLAFCILVSWLRAHRRRCSPVSCSQRNGKREKQEGCIVKVRPRPLFEPRHTCLAPF